MDIKKIEGRSLWFDTIEKYNEDDFILWSSIFSIDNLPEARKNFWVDKIQFNQTRIDYSWCVYHAWTWCIADESKLFNYTLFLETCNKLKYKYGYHDHHWMYIYKGVDMVRNIHNKNNPKDRLISFRVKIGWKEFFEALKKWYSIHAGYQWNHQYNLDKNDDWILEKTKFWKATYWHSIRLTMKNNKIYVVDNYFWIKYNIYEIPHIEKLVENNVFFWYWYIYVFENDFINNKKIMTQNEKDIQMVKRAFTLWITNNKQNVTDVENKSYTQDVKTLLMVMRTYTLLKWNKDN